MAVIGRWSGGTTTQLPTTSWAAPNGIVTTEDRNDGSAYGYASSTSTITLPSSDLADGYLIVGSFVLDDTSNGRCNPAGRWVQASGTGNFLSSQTTGYNRNTNNQLSYVRTWAFIDTPSASATVQFEWLRDIDAPTGGTREAYFEIIPFFYDNIGMYEAASTSLYGGTTPNQVTGFSTVYESTTIRSTDELVLPAGDFLALGSWYMDLNGGRSQRWGGFRLNGTKLDDAKAYAYLRNPSNGLGGEMFSTMVSGSNTLDMFLYRGDGVLAGEGGASIDGGSGSTLTPHYAMVVIQLPSSADFDSTTNSSISPDLDAATPTAMGLNLTAPATTDLLVGADISGASYNVTTGTRATIEAHVTVAGTSQANTISGDYLRNAQGGQSTFGVSANLLGSMDVTSGDTIDVSSARGDVDAGGDPASPIGWQGLWYLDIDSMSSGPSPITGTLSAQESGSDTFTGTGEVPISGSLSAQETGSDTFTGVGEVAISGSLAVQESGSDTFTGTGTVAFPGITGTLAVQEAGQDKMNAAGTVAITGTLAAQETGEDKFNGEGTVAISGTLSVQESGSDTFTGTGIVFFPGITGSLSVQESGSDVFTGTGIVFTPGITGSLSVQEIGSDTFTGAGTVAITGALTAQEAGSDTFSGTGAVAISGVLAAQETGSDTFSGNGTVAISGTLSAQESGSDIFSGTGTVTFPDITGSLFTQESGSDVFSGSGTVTFPDITGSLFAQESGSDTFAGTGTVFFPDIEGVLAAQETGSDTFSAAGAVTFPDITGFLAAQETGKDIATINGLTRLYSDIDTSQPASFGDINTNQDPMYRDVDNVQAGSYTDVDDSQADSWVDVDTNQPPNYTPI